MSVGGIFECYSKPMDVVRLQRSEGRSLIDVDTIGLKALPPMCISPFTPPGEGRRHAGGSMTFRCPDGRHPERQAPDLRKEKRTMAEFNAMDTAAFKGVWVFCEQREGESSPSAQLL